MLALSVATEKTHGYLAVPAYLPVRNIGATTTECWPFLGDPCRPQPTP